MQALPPFLSLLPSLLLFLILHISSTHSLTHVFNTAAPCVQLGACSYLDASTWEDGAIPNRRGEDVIIECPSPITLTLAGEKNYPSQDFFSANNLVLKGNIIFIISNVLLTTSALHASDSQVTIKVVNNATFSAISGNLNQTLSTGNSLFVSGNSIVVVNTIKVDFVQIIDSTFTGYTFEGSIQASGSKTKISFTSLRTQNTTFDGISQLTVKSVILSMGALNIVNISHVAFDEIIMGDNSTFEYTPPNKLNYLMDTGRISVPQIPLTRRPKLVFHENSRFTVGSIYGPTDFVLGNNAILNVDGYKIVDFYGIHQAPNSYALIVALVADLIFSENITFQGPIMQGMSGSATVLGSLTLAPFVGSERRCMVGGSLAITNGGSLTCYGTIDMISVHVYQGHMFTSETVTAQAMYMSEATITASKLAAGQIDAKNSSVTADVSVRGYDGTRIRDKTLFINGSYLQVGGFLTPSCDDKSFTPPFLLVTGQITLQRVKLVLSKKVLSHGKLLIAKSLEKTIFVDPYPLEATYEDETVSFAVSIQNGEISFTRSTLRPYQVLLAVSVTLISIFSLLTYYYRIWKKSHVPANEHELAALRT